MILFKCENCGYAKEVSEKYSGKEGRCPKCKAKVRVPSAAGGAGLSAKTIIKFYCPSCHKKIGLGPEYAGKQVRCAACRNPLIVPGGSKPSGGPGRRDDVSVLRAGHESPNKGEEKWGDMEEVVELRMVEESAPSIDVEQPFKLKEVEDETVDRSATAADMAAKGVRSRSGGKEKKVKTGVSNNIRAIIIVAVVCGAILFEVIAGASWIADYVSKINEMGQEYSHVQKFAKDCILMLSEGNTSGAEELFSDELYNSSQSGELEEFSGKVSKATTSRLQLMVSKVHKKPDGREFVMSYMIKQDGETFSEQDGLNIFVCVWEIDGGLMIDELAVIDISGETTSIGHSNHDKMVSRLVRSDEEPGDIKSKMPLYFLGVMAGLMLFVVVSMYVVFSKAGQPGWAIFVPFYNSWVYAEVGDRPGWMGLLMNISSAIPYIGWVVGLVLSVYISIGVAAAFDRGILFGAGLAFLPFIFFPILAFASD
jgi:hypothetical protein